MQGFEQGYAGFTAGKPFGFAANMFKRIPRDCGPNRMRLSALAESSTEKSAASDITLVLQSFSLTRSYYSNRSLLHLSLPGRQLSTLWKSAFSRLSTRVTNHV